MTELEAETIVDKLKEELAAIVFRAIGAGSMCWCEVQDAGTFDDLGAKHVGEETVRELRELLVQRLVEETGGNS